MSANTQTLVGQAPKPVEEPAGTTSGNAGKKRKTPVKAAACAPKGGQQWPDEEVSDTSSAVKHRN